MACSNGELVGDVGQNKRRRRSHASDFWARNSSHRFLQEEASALSELPKLDSFAFTLARYTSTHTEQRPNNADEEQEEQERSQVSASSATKKPLQAPTVCEEAHKENSLKPPEVRTEQRPDNAEDEQEVLGRSQVSASSATKKPLQAPTVGEAHRENPLKPPEVHTGVIPSLKCRNIIVGHGEDCLPNFGEVIPGACEALFNIALQLVADLDSLTFKAPVSCVYNPLVYAQNLHVQYIKKHGGRRVEVLLVGMNPGPFGMAQTGVPFGDSKFVRTFHGLSGKVDSPKILHPKRPVHGLNCRRSEVSGQRLWGWAQDRFGCATAFFNRFWVYNYCPLVFMEASGKNRTPDKLHPPERANLEVVCNEALIKTISILRPAFVVGVGKYAAIKIQQCNIAGVKVGDIMHPSPANPQANKDWGKKVEDQLVKLGLVLDM